jgi:hypothetical protein
VDAKRWSVSDKWGRTKANAKHGRHVSNGATLATAPREQRRHVGLRTCPLGMIVALWIGCAALVIVATSACPPS